MSGEQDMTLTTEAALELQRRYAAACREGDLDAMRELSEPDAVIWHNFDERELTAEQGVASLKWIHRVVPDARWEDIAVHATRNGFVWQTIVSGHAPGGEMRAHTCVVVTVSESGKIARTEEYVDRAALDPLPL
jgi:ketosteroid isomerase-like protein